MLADVTGVGFVDASSVAVVAFLLIINFFHSLSLAARALDVSYVRDLVCLRVENALEAKLKGNHRVHPLKSVLVEHKVARIAFA